MASLKERWRMADVIYIKKSNDKYEQILEMADTARELAKKLGVPVGSIYSSISHARHGRIKHTPYERVELDKED